jgi:Flp pilus assembly secretin CpaC
MHGGKREPCASGVRTRPPPLCVALADETVALASGQGVAVAGLRREEAARSAK